MFAQPGVVTEEGEASGGMKFKQPRQEQAAEQFGQDTDLKQKGRPGRHPARAVQRNAATRHDHVDVRMVRHRLTARKVVRKVTAKRRAKAA